MGHKRDSAPTRRTLVRRLVLGALLLVLVFYAGGGWYFSSQIRTDALEVRTYPDENDLRVSLIAFGTLSIQSRDVEELTMVRAPSTFGVEWKDGYGRVSGPVVSETEDRVVRRFEVVTGDPPEGLTTANLDLAAYPDDPRTALGPGVREVEYTSPLGRFPAWFVAGGTGPKAQRSSGTSGTWAILVHGKGGSRTEMLRMTRATVAAGLPSLDITYRNDEGLPRDRSNHYQFGRTEWRDLQGAIAYASRHGAERVVLGADSMGGAIVAAYLEQRKPDTKEPRVVGLVLDAPMLDLAETVRFGARQIELPVLGPVPDSLTWTAQRIAAVRDDIDWNALDYLDDTSWLKAPTLVFHGTADTTVPLSTSRELAEDLPGKVTLVETTGVEHVRSWNADPQAYDAHIRDLVEQVDR